MGLLLLLSLGCTKKVDAPKGPEQDLILTLEQTLSTDPRQAVALYDAELRQKMDLFEEITRAPGPERLKILEAAQPRLGEQVALETFRSELGAELRKGELATALVRGGCAWGLPSPEDGELYASHELPAPKPEMGPTLGRFLFDLHQQIGYITKGRLTCPGGQTAWIQVVKRKGTGPLRILRIAP